MREFSCACILVNYKCRIKRHVALMEKYLLKMETAHVEVTSTYVGSCVCACVRACVHSYLDNSTMRSPRSPQPDRRNFRPREVVPGHCTDVIGS